MTDRVAIDALKQKLGAVLNQVCPHPNTAACALAEVLACALAVHVPDGQLQASLASLFPVIEAHARAIYDTRGELPYRAGRGAP